MNSSKIIVAGQTPAERAALEWAVETGVDCGGWCPKDRSAAIGFFAGKPDIKETPSSNPLQCSEWNVWDADGVVIITTTRQLSEDCQKTGEFAAKHHKPLLHVLADSKFTARQLGDFLEKNRIRELNVVCCQATEEEEMTGLVPLILAEVFSPILEQPPLPASPDQNNNPMADHDNRLQTVADLLPNKTSSEDVDNSFVESLWVSTYRASEGSKEHAAMLRNFIPPVAIDLDDDSDLSHMRSVWICSMQSNYAEAARHLDKISAGMREYPLVLHLSQFVYAATGNWKKLVELGQKYSQCRPGDSLGWQMWAIALDKMGRTKEAHAVLISVLERFPADFFFPYNLACFACRMGRQDEAWEWVQKAFRLTTLERFKLWLLTDDDLKPLRGRIDELSQTRLI